MTSSQLFLDNSNRLHRGVRRIVPVKKPAAAAEWTVSVPGGVMWRMLAGYAQLTTSATVSTRNLGLSVTNEGVTLFFDTSITGIGASSTANLHMVPSIPFLNALTRGQEVWCNFPLFLLEEGWVITSLQPAPGSGLAAGDQYTAVSLLVDEYYFTNQELSDLDETQRTAERNLEFNYATLT